MAGLGKPTLAKRVCDDSLFKYCFPICGWAFVSQEYKKRDFLLHRLGSFCQDTNGIHQKSETKLGEKLCECLKGKSYLIVVDDIWDSKAWIDLMNCFPKDNKEVENSVHKSIGRCGFACHVSPSRPPLFLWFLTHDESWDLPRSKVFGIEGICPPELVGI